MAFVCSFVGSGHELQQSSKPSHSENWTNKGSLCTTRERIYFSPCPYSSSNTMGTSIWARFLRHKGNTKSLLPSCIHTAVLPNGTIGGSRSKVRAEPSPPCGQREGVALPSPQTQGAGDLGCGGSWKSLPHGVWMLHITYSRLF